MENKTSSKDKSRNYDESKNDEFILNLVDLNDSLDLRKSNDRE